MTLTTTKTNGPDLPWWVGQSGPLAVWAWEYVPEWREKAVRACDVDQYVYMRQWAEELWAEHVAGQQPVGEELSEA